MLNYLIKGLKKKRGVILVAKAIIKSINSTGNRCIVQIPLFETASSSVPIEIEATVCITPGIFSNLAVGDVVFVTFEENAMEKPVIIGKLFKNALSENNIAGGAGVFSSLKVNSSAILPSSTIFEFPALTRNEYQDLKTPKKLADYIKWLEKLTKKLITQLDDHFRCFKNWTQWQLRPENLEIDDGDIDTGYNLAEPFQYQAEGDECRICGNNCTKNQARCYLKIDKDKTYPNI